MDKTKSRTFFEDVLDGHFRFCPCPKLENDLRTNSRHFRFCLRDRHTIGLKAVNRWCPWLGPRQEQEQEQGAKAPPPVTLSVSVLAKAREKEKKFFEVKIMRKKKKRSKSLEVARKMPPLYHTLPGEQFDLKKSEVVKWISEQPQLQAWVLDQLKSAGYVEYDPETGLWSGIEC